ncbi:MAG: hypothetical protein IPI53_16630 [Saprospiraceae bacterium]|nr:hypothetical protein [Saprospiraceae bacterium]
MSKVNRPTTFYATISITIVLILVGLFLTLFMHTGNITNILKQNINLLAEVQDVLPESEIQRLIDIIKTTEGVLPQSIEFIKKKRHWNSWQGNLASLRMSLKILSKISLSLTSKLNTIMKNE